MTSPWPQPEESAAAADRLLGDARLIERPLTLHANGYELSIRSNSQALLDRLAHYFAHLPVTSSQQELEIIVVERPALDTGLPFIEWHREPGKQGRKDAYLDLTDGRLLLKVRTGMLFLQSEKRRIAAGPCLANDNQVINFINSQLMNHLHQNGWLICHAAALGKENHAIALAGFSGNGKSTLMLHLMEKPDYRYLTNDRLFLRQSNPLPWAAGIPKLPRINPGTLIGNPRLHALLHPERRKILEQLPQHELWALEEKHDVDIATLYGKDRINTSTPLPLRSLLILNWRLGINEPLRLQRINLTQRMDLLPAIMKTPGPFYHNSAGRFQRDDDDLPERDYTHILSRVTVFEVSGGIDFKALVNLLNDEDL